MTMQTFRQQLIAKLLEVYRGQSWQLQQVEHGLRQLGVATITFDHFAVIDLPSRETGIPVLSEIFTALGYEKRGTGYLPDKQNDFHWLAETDSEERLATEVLPQAVVADFRLDELPIEIRNMIAKYAQQAPTAPVAKVQRLVAQLQAGESGATEQLYTLLLRYFSGRDWALPTVKEFHTVREFNELLAWVLVFGRRPNHFTISAHLLARFADLQTFLEYVTRDLGLPLNVESGAIKGSKQDGIAQGSTDGPLHRVRLSDGEIELPGDFVEFVWRFGVVEQPKKWGDYFTGFVAKNADKVIHSLYGE
jgi:hypothetical protein